MGNKQQNVPLGLADFAGRWELRREIADGLSGLRGVLEGAAVLSWDGDALVYAESGVLRYGDGAPMQTTRSYRWEATETGIAVFFADGRFFHTLPLAGGEAMHDCAPDTYRVAYDFNDWPHWQAVWRVHGPRKAYVMTSRYARAVTRE